MPLPLPQLCAAEPGWVFWPAALSKHIPSAAWSISYSSLALSDDSLLLLGAWCWGGHSRWCLQAGGTLCQGKSHIQGLHWAVQGVMQQKRGCPWQWQSSGCKIRSCQARRRGHPGHRCHLEKFCRKSHSPGQAGEGFQLGRKFLEVRERVGYELNSSSYPPFTAKIEHLSQVPLHVFLPYCTLAPC